MANGKANQDCYGVEDNRTHMAMINWMIFGERNEDQLYFEQEHVGGEDICREIMRRFQLIVNQLSSSLSHLRVEQSGLMGLLFQQSFHSFFSHHLSGSCEPWQHNKTALPEYLVLTWRKCFQYPRHLQWDGEWVAGPSFWWHFLSNQGYSPQGRLPIRRWI